MATLPWHNYTIWLPYHLLLDASYVMVWQEGKEAPLYIGAHWCYSISMWQLPHSSLQKYATLDFFSSLSNYAKYLIFENSCLAMKHGNSSLLPFSNSSRTFKYILLFSTCLQKLHYTRRCAWCKICLKSFYHVKITIVTGVQGICWML